MGKNSAIEWTNHTWNPFIGCHKVSPGCLNCYMFREQKQYGHDPNVVRRSKTTFNAPLNWKEPAYVFTCSWSDFFIEEADPWRDEAWDIIRRTPHLTYQILTKRIENVEKRLPGDWSKGWENVWLGVTVENDDYLWRVDELAKIPATMRFVSLEPLLGPVDLGLSGTCPKDWGVGYRPVSELLHWVIIGGESGPDPRPMNHDWARDIIRECELAEIPVFLKQLGGSKKVGGAWGGRELDGKTWSQMPSVR